MIQVYSLGPGCIENVHRKQKNQLKQGLREDPHKRREGENDSHNTGRRMVLEASESSASSPDKEYFTARVARDVELFTVFVESEADGTEAA